MTSLMAHRVREINCQGKEGGWRVFCHNNMTFLFLKESLGKVIPYLLKINLNHVTDDVTSLRT